MRTMMRAVAVAFAVTAALAGCSSSTGTTQATPGRPVDPVPILQATTATPAPGTVTGSRDVYGDLSASGAYPGGELVTVYTCATPADYAREKGFLAPADGLGEVTIPGKLAVIQVTAVADLTTGGYAWQVTPEQVAADVGGLVIQP